MSNAGPSLREKRERIDRFGVLALYEIVLGHEVRVGKTFTSPLRDDRSPSFNIYRGANGKFLWKDFADDRGDIYSLMMKLHDIGFKEAIDRLYEMTGSSTFVNAVAKRMVRSTLIRPAKRATITTTYRSITDADKALWKQWGIGHMLLLRMRVHSLEKAHIVPASADKKQVTIEHEEDNPLYGIFINERVKIYRPKNPDRKFKMIGNTGSEDVFGLEQLELDGNVRDLVIAGGNKDTMAWMGNAMGDSLAAVCTNSENINIPEHIMLRLSRKAKNVWICYDNDPTGIRQQKLIREAYPFIKPIDLPAITKEKDFAKMVESGRTAELQHIRNVIAYS